MQHFSNWGRILISYITFATVDIFMKAISENIRLWWGLRERVEVFKIFYTRNLGAFYTSWPHEPALMGCESERAALMNTWYSATMVWDLYQFSTFHVILYLHKSNQSLSKIQSRESQCGNGKDGSYFLR